MNTNLKKFQWNKNNMNKTKNEFIEYYKKVIEYLKNKKMEFCFGEDGQFLTLENCQKSIEFYKNK